jgi:beta-lactamase class A
MTPIATISSSPRLRTESSNALAEPSNAMVIAAGSSVAASARIASTASPSATPGRRPNEIAAAEKRDRQHQQAGCNRPADEQRRDIQVRK